MTGMNVYEFMENIPLSIDKDLARGINARILFVLSGPQGGEWGLILNDQECRMLPNRIDNPNLTLKSDAVFAIRVLSGEVDGMRAFLMGKLKLLGDISLAIKLMNLAKR